MLDDINMCIHEYDAFNHDHIRCVRTCDVSCIAVVLSVGLLRGLCSVLTSLTGGSLLV